ncbi:MAG: hypothetical protein LIO75_03325 [Lachnospiraceae bacterium]|nr:hypothetical protein [Lachnospiraceae bacterium]
MEKIRSKERKSSLYTAVLLIVPAVILAIACESYVTWWNGLQGVVLREGVCVFLQGFCAALNLHRMAVFFIILLFLCFFVHHFADRIGSFVYRYRWLIGFAVIAAAVIFELSGSSIGMWQSYVTDPEVTDTGVLLGQSRPIRTDEWAVFTPMTYSQYFSGFSVFSSIFRATDTDMYLVYGQPVMDWSVIFRPFEIGYLFLSPARGQAFYWSGKLVFLFLVSFEMGMLITGKKKSLSVVYAMMMAFAPIVQWWFGMNSFPEMLVYGQDIVLLVAAYMRTRNYWKRILCGAGFVIAAGAYLLVMYPAWQIPFFYVFLLAGIWVIWDHWKSFRRSLRKDLPIVIGCIGILIICMLLIVLRSWDTILAEMGSVYPGDRVETGGRGLACLFKYVGNLFLPIDDSLAGTNQSEAADFFSLFPIGIVLSLWVLFRDKCRDRLIILLWAAEIFLGIYVLAGFPAILSKVSLLSNSQMVRAVIAFGFVQVLMLIRAMSVRKSGMRVYFAIPLAGILSVVMVYGSRYFFYGEYLNPCRMAVSAVMIAVFFFLVLCRGKRMRTCFCVLMCAVMLFEGGAVNPLRSGTDVIDDNRLSRAIREIQEEEEGTWIAEDLWYYANFAAMNGAPAINATNTYYNAELWSVLDPTGENEDVYNRYAHIRINLTENETTYELESMDAVHISLNVADLGKIGVNYIITANSLEQYDSEACSFTLLFAEDDMDLRIYKVSYAE